MRRSGVPALLALLLAVLAVTGGPSDEPTPAERVRQFRRDRELVEALVDEGIQLAGEPDPVKRAGRCGTLAELLAEEVRQAGAARDAFRAAELGKHLESFLESGVADNLREAPPTAPGTSLGQKYRELGKQMKELEEGLGQADGPAAEALRHALGAVRKGRAKVQQVIESKIRDAKKNPHPLHR